MNITFGAVIITIGLAALAAVADYYLKLSSSHRHPFLTRSFWVGIGMYTLLAFGVVYVFNHIKMAAVGAIYCVSLVVLLALCGVVIFREPLNRYEYLGLALAVLSVFMLWRFA